MAIVTKLFIGCNDQDTKTQEKSCDEIKKLIHDILLLHNFDAYTLQDANGVFTHANGVVVNEKTFIITLVNIKDELALKLAIDNLKIALNQESIMLERYTASIQFL